MEIFTSITFWAIVIAVIVILAIIGYVAEGTIFANKKEEEKLKKNESTTWTEVTPTEADIKQEKVYTVTDNNWLEMPDINAKETIDEPVQTPIEPTPAVEPVQTPIEPTPAVEPVQTPVEPTPAVEPVQTPVEPMPAVEPVQTPIEPMPAVEPVQTPVAPMPAVEPVPAPVEPMPAVEPVPAPVEPMPAVEPVQTPVEPMQVPAETLQPQTNTINNNQSV